MLPALLLLQLLSSGLAMSPPSSHFWRNDSANLALAAAWNRECAACCDGHRSALRVDAAPRLAAGYYDATPFSWDVTSPNVSDAPPIGLDWSMGRDGPLPCAHNAVSR